MHPRRQRMILEWLFIVLVALAVLAVGSMLAGCTGDRTVAVEAQLQATQAKLADVQDQLDHARSAQAPADELAALQAQVDELQHQVGQQLAELLAAKAQDTRDQVVSLPDTLLNLVVTGGAVLALNARRNATRRVALDAKADKGG